MEENNVHIIEWPKDPAILEHQFPDPVGINISAPIDVNIPNPVDLNMFNTSEKPLFLNMNLQDGGYIPVCIKLCEPICAESNYKVGITLMGQPFIEIAVQGITRLFNCNSKTSTNSDVASVTVK
jgi:hypothetical protein